MAWECTDGAVMELLRARDPTGGSNECDAWFLDQRLHCCSCAMSCVLHVYFQLMLPIHVNASHPSCIDAHTHARVQAWAWATTPPP